MLDPNQLTLDLRDSAERAASPRVRFSRRARRLILKVHTDGEAEVVAPIGTSERNIVRFVEEHRDWIAKTRDAQLAAHPPVDRQRPDHIVLPACGEHWRIVRRPQKSDSLRARRLPDDTPDRFVVCVDGRPLASEDVVRDAVRRLVIQRARDAFESRLPQFAAALGSRYNRLQVRDQKTCWGSYSARGTLSMNYAAIFLRPELFDYLCVHELAHYHHMDHSRAFWRCTESVLPNARALDRELGSTRAVVPPWLWST
ncbi:MAG: SprT family zinc-dependent metalloprotease [Pseudomonadota bacterium]